MSIPIFIKYSNRFKQRSRYQFKKSPIFQCKNGKYVVSNENELNYVLLAKGTNQKKQLLHDFAQDFYTPINIAPLLDEFNNFF